MKGSTTITIRAARFVLVCLLAVPCLCGASDEKKEEAAPSAPPTSTAPSAPTSAYVNGVKRALTPTLPNAARVKRAIIPSTPASVSRLKRTLGVSALPLAAAKKTSAPAGVKATPAPTPLAVSGTKKPATAPAAGTEKTASPPIDDTYDKLVTPAAFKKFDKAHIGQMQAGLYEIYKDDPAYLNLYGDTQKPLSDSTLGPVTLFWLKRFCSDFRIEGGKDFADEADASLLHFAEIARAQPDWKKILLSADFERWLDNQPESQKGGLYKIRRSGTAQQVISLMKKYARRAQPQATKPIPDGPSLLTLNVFQLTGNDVDLLQKRQTLLQKLALLQDESFPSRREFQAAVMVTLKDITDKPEQYLPMVEKYAEYSETYTLTDHSLQKLKVDGMSDDMVSALEPLLDLDFSETDFIDKVKSKTPLTESQKNSIMRAAEVAHGYSLTESSLKELAADPVNASVPNALLGVLAPIKNVEYPTRELFRSAALSQIGVGISACSQNIPAYRRENLIDPPMSAENFQALKDGLPEELFSKLEALRNRTTLCSKDELATVSPLIEKLYEIYRPAIEGQAIKTPVFDHIPPIQWSGGSCNCLLDQLAGTVYGFYPLWLSNGQTQQVNFSVLSRIGYYGISFDDQGDLRLANSGDGIPDDLFGSTNGAATDFIRTARKYGTKVDLVVERSDWQAWPSYGMEQKAHIFDRLATNIVRLVSRKLSDPISSLTPYSSFGAAFQPTEADGVTLHFDGYPTDGDSVALFDNFITKLKGKLKAAGNHYALNLMMSQSYLGPADRGIYDYAHLLKLVKLIDPVDDSEPISEKDMAKKFESRVLVLMYEPTSNAKKRLRLEIEESLHGTVRRLLQRKIVPIMEFNGTAWQQLENNVIYAKDNFGGFGFWPMPFVNPENAGAAAKINVSDTCSDLKTVDGCLTREYQEDDARPVSVVCSVVCPNRWIFRFSWDIFALLLTSAVILYFWSCRGRAILEKYWIAFVLGIFLPTFGISMALLSCDPFLKNMSRGNWPLIFVVLAIIGYSIWRHFERKAKADIP